MPSFRRKQKAQKRIDTLRPRVLIVTASGHAKILHLRFAPAPPLEQAMQFVALLDHRRPLGEPHIQPDAWSRFRSRTSYIPEHGASGPPYRWRKHRQPSEDLGPCQSDI